MFEIVFLVFAGIYFLILVFLSSGFIQNIKTITHSPFVSVIIAARNEEKNILQCMESLVKQDYHKDSFEVVIADDFSSDRTADIIMEFISDKTNFRLIIPPPENKLKGKTNALNSAVETAGGEILLFTDADCIVPPGWISGIIKYYSPGVSMVNSFSTTTANDIFSGIQSIDYIFLVSIAAGMANNNHPVSCIGNNMSVRRSAFDETGGYTKFPSGVTEDYSLLNALSKAGKKIFFVCGKDVLAETKAAGSAAELLAQKKRWAIGGLSEINESIFLMIIAWMTNLLTLISPLFFSKTVLLIIIMKIFSEYLFLYQVHKKLGAEKNLRYFIWFELYYIIYTSLLPVMLIFSRRIRWKERVY